MLTDDPFELMDAESGNLIGTYPTQEAALEIVRSSVERYGVDSMLRVGLGGEDASGKDVLIAYGEELIRLAFPDPPPVSAAS